MLKKSITYQDLEGETVTEDFYFNLNKAELLELNLTDSGVSLEDYMTALIKTRNSKAIYQMFKDIILASYGEKDPLGKRFVKSAALRESFMQTEAFSELIMEFFTNPASAATFIQACMPQDLVKAAEAELQAAEAKAQAQDEGDNVVNPDQIELPNVAKPLDQMTPEELIAYGESLKPTTHQL